MTVSTSIAIEKSVTCHYELDEITNCPAYEQTIGSLGQKEKVAGNDEQNQQHEHDRQKSRDLVTRAFPRAVFHEGCLYEDWLRRV